MKQRRLSEFITGMIFDRFMTARSSIVIVLKSRNVMTDQFLLAVVLHDLIDEGPF